MADLSILIGPVEPRTNEAARAGIPLSAANARHILRDMESQIKSRSKRAAMAAMFADRATNATDEARAVYRAYAESPTINLLPWPSSEKAARALGFDTESPSFAEARAYWAKRESQS